MGTLREGAGNDCDQSSLLIAVLRAAGFSARYEISAVVVSDEQARTYAGTSTLEAAATLLATAGVPLQLHPGGRPGPEDGARLGARLRPCHRLPRRGPPRLRLSWVNLDPSLKSVTRSTPVNLRNAVAFDFNGYLAAPTTRPSDAYFQQVRSYIKSQNIKCETLESDVSRRWHHHLVRRLLHDRREGIRSNARTGASRHEES